MDNLHSPAVIAADVPADEGYVAPQDVQIDRPSVDLPTDIPIDQWEAIHGHPYSVEHFNLENWDELNGITDSQGLRDKVELIEKYYHLVRDGRSLNDDKNTYNDILNEISEAIGIDDNENVSSKISRIAQFIIVSQKSKSIEERYGNTKS